MRLVYLAPIRLPTEKAHGLQIVQNCEAFAESGADVELWAARRLNTAELRGVSDIWTHYGVTQNFTLRRLPCIDLLPWSGEAGGFAAKAAFILFTLSYALVAALMLLLVRADVVYSRDPLTLVAAGILNFRRRKLIYEAHALAQSGRAKAIQRWAMRVSHLTVAITPPMRDDLLAQLPSAEVMVAHDGVRAERFAQPPEMAAARTELGWPHDGLIVGYVGRLHTMGMAKGVDTLIDAIAQMPSDLRPAIGIVGGPDEQAEAYRQVWISLGLPPEGFLYAGQLSAARVPVALAACDMLAMPLPYTPHFARHASPLKLFEYMAAGRAIIATEFPSYADVVTSGRDSLLTPPGDVDALCAALSRLAADANLRARLGTNARERALHLYTWQARARAILERVQGAALQPARD